MKKYSWALLAALMTTQVVAQNEQQEEEMDAIATDRPDITESAFITPVGWLQYEGGYQFSQSTDNFNTTTARHQIEEVIRFGLTEKFEVRAVINTNTEGYENPAIFINPTRVRGIEPLTVGFKYNLAQEHGWVPQTTWLSHVSLPWIAVGDYRAVFQSNTVFHEQRLMMEKSITDRFGLATNIGVAGGLSGSTGFIDQGMFSLAAGYDLGNDFGIYIEYFADWQLVANQFTAVPYIDGGFTKLLNNDLQLDIYGGLDISSYTGATAPSTGFFIGTGVSYRLPVAHYFR